MKVDDNAVRQRISQINAVPSNHTHDSDKSTKQSQMNVAHRFRHSEKLGLMSQKWTKKNTVHGDLSRFSPLNTWNYLKRDTDPLSKRFSPNKSFRELYRDLILSVFDSYPPPFHESPWNLPSSVLRRMPERLNLLFWSKRLSQHLITTFYQPSVAQNLYQVIVRDERGQE
jgi:hypothetical protein